MALVFRLRCRLRLICDVTVSHSHMQVRKQPSFIADKDSSLQPPAISKLVQSYICRARPAHFSAHHCIPAQTHLPIDKVTPLCQDQLSCLQNFTKPTTAHNEQQQHARCRRARRRPAGLPRQGVRCRKASLRTRSAGATFTTTCGIPIKLRTTRISVR